MRLQWLMSFPLLIVLLLPFPTRATTILRVPVSEMAQGSDLIVMGTVSAITPLTDAGNPKKLRTQITVTVKKTLKGRATTSTIKMVFPGGRNDQWRVSVPGMPSFKKGEEVVLFLEKTEKGYTPAGLSLGKFSVVRDMATKRATASRKVAQGVDLVREKNGRMRVPQTSERQDVFELDELIRIIRNAQKPLGGVR